MLLGNEEEKTDVELVEREEKEIVLLGQLTRAQWSTVLANDARGRLLEVARSGDWQRVIAFLGDIGADCGRAPPLLGDNYEVSFPFASLTTFASPTR